MRTGYLPHGPIQYPTLGSLVAKEIGADDGAAAQLRQHRAVSACSARRRTARLPGPQYAPLIVGETATIRSQASRATTTTRRCKVQDLDRRPTWSSDRSTPASTCCRTCRTDFVDQRPGVSPQSHQTAYERAVRLMRTAAAKAFNLDEEPAALRDAYGRNLFGQGCLLARRLVEQGVPFVEVTLGGSTATPSAGTRTHNNFDGVKQLSGVLDPAWATLMEDLQAARPARLRR